MANVHALVQRIIQQKQKWSQAAAGDRALGIEVAQDKTKSAHTPYLSTEGADLILSCCADVA